MEVKGINTVLAIVVVAVVVTAVAAIWLILPKTYTPPPIRELIFDDFDDGTLGPNFPGTSAGMMGGYPPDPHGFEFVRTDDGRAIKMMIDVPAGKWSGYWSFMVPGDISRDPIIVSLGAGYDLSGYSELKMVVRADKEIAIKIELQDTVQQSDPVRAQIVFTRSASAPCIQKYAMDPRNLALKIFGTAPTDISQLTYDQVFTATQSHIRSVKRTVKTSWTELVIPLREFEPATTPSAYGLNLKDIRQLNIIFEGPISTSLYIDKITFI